MARTLLGPTEPGRWLLLVSGCLHGAMVVEWVALNHRVKHGLRPEASDAFLRGVSGSTLTSLPARRAIMWT